MSEKRPTRKEALEAAKAGWSSQIPGNVVTMGSAGEASVDAVAALFGGYATEPVEVPRFDVEGAQRTVNLAAAAARPLPPGADAYWPTVYAAVAARSNAWEEIKEGLRVAAAHQAAHELSAALTKVRWALEIMSRPEMGVGPKEGL